MYCTRCGKKIPETSKFCNYCGRPVPIVKNTNSAITYQSRYDVVADIQKKLREIDDRKRAPDNVIKSAIKVIKRETSALDLVFNGFEAQKLTDKKQLIQDYPLPSSPTALAGLANYINSEIVSKKREPDALTAVWKEKLKQIYYYAKAELRNTEEFVEIKKYYIDNRRREKRSEIRGFIPILICPIMLALISSIFSQLPLLMFVSILALAWEIILILYVNDLLDNMITSIKQHSAKSKNIPKSLRVVAWYLLIPALAALIVSIAYQWEGLIWLTAVLFGVDALFLIEFLCSVYES